MNIKIVKYCVILMIAVSTVVIYWQVMKHDFINYDDDVYVTDNYHIRDGVTSQGVIWAFTSSHGSNWHPLTSLSHMIDIQLFDLNPMYHHLINVIFHIANALLLFYVFYLMTGDFWKCSFVATLFALHPLHVESVAWVAERKDVLSTFFWMLTIGAYVKYVRQKTLYHYLLVMLLFIFGLLAKPMVVTLPFVLLLLDIWPLGRMGNSSINMYRGNDISDTSIKKCFFEKIPLLALTASSSVITYMVQKHAGAVNTFEQIPFDKRIANALITYVEYIKKMFVPVDLSVIYPFSTDISHLWTIASTFILIITSLFAIRVLNKRPYFFVGWFWYLGTLIPVIGLIQVGSQAMADRYTYIPLIGLFIFMVWGISGLIENIRYKKSLIFASYIIIIVTFASLSWHQIAYWKNSTTLFQHSIEVTNQNLKAHINLGTSLQRKGQIDEAFSNYKYVLDFDPNNVMAHINIGTIYEAKDQIDKAYSHYKYALDIDPHNVMAHTNIGTILDKKGLNEEAIEHYYKALEVNPLSVKTHNNLGVALFNKGLQKEAVEEFKKALSIDPNYQPAKNNIKLIFKSKEYSIN